MDRKVLSVALSLALSVLVCTSAVWANESSGHPRSQVAAADDSGAVVLYALPSNGEMRVTAKRPVQLPGAVLQPGQYTLRLNDADTSVAVTNVDGSEFYGNYLIVPASRSHRDDTVAYTAAAPAGGPDRLMSVFRPGALWGYAFVYPKAKHGNVQIAAK